MTDVKQSVALVHAFMIKAADVLVNYGFEILAAILILILGFLVSRWVAGMALNMLKRKGVDVTVAEFLAAGVRWIILAFAMMVALGKFGITIAPIIAAAGAIAFGSTFALQGVLSNMGSGLSLLFFRPFKVGDTIAVANASGVVEEVRLGATILVNEDGERITVPNRHIVGEVVRNSFANRVTELTVGVSYGEDPQRAIRVIQEALTRSPDVASRPAPTVGVQEFGDSAILLGVRYWVPTPRYIQVSNAANLAVIQALMREGIDIPFPQRDVRVIRPSRKRTAPPSGGERVGPGGTTTNTT